MSERLSNDRLAEIGRTADHTGHGASGEETRALVAEVQRARLSSTPSRDLIIELVALACAAEFLHKYDNDSIQSADWSEIAVNISCHAARLLKPGE